MHSGSGMLRVQTHSVSGTGAKLEREIRWRSTFKKKKSTLRSIRNPFRLCSLLTHCNHMLWKQIWGCHFRLCFFFFFFLLISITTGKIAMKFGTDIRNPRWWILSGQSFYFPVKFLKIHFSWIWIHEVKPSTVSVAVIAVDITVNNPFKKYPRNEYIFTSAGSIYIKDKWHLTAN